MKILTFLIFGSISLNVFGQSHLFGVKSGVVLADINSENDRINSDIRVGISAGLSYDYLVRDRFSFGVDVIFQQQGFTNNFIVEDGYGHPTGRVITTEFEYDYLSFPIKTGAYVGKKLFAFGQFGVVPCFLLAAKISPGSDHPKMPFPVTTFDFAGTIELGVGYKLDQFWFSLSTRYQRSFLTFKNVDYFGETKLSHRGLTSFLTLRYQLPTYSNHQ